jgi:hypothetical protein
VDVARRLDPAANRAHVDVSVDDVDEAEGTSTRLDKLSGPVATQAEIYARLAETDLDPELSWSESELPERERTKHVHRLHPYLGKYVPQLVEIFLQRHFTKNSVILDPFAGSGTTLVECSTYGCRGVGVDISAFNALLSRVKTAAHNPFVVERDLRAALAELSAVVNQRGGQLSLGETLAPVDGAGRPSDTSEWLATWFDPQALSELLVYRAQIRKHTESADLMKVVLCRAARSARLVTHFDLDFPKKPQTEPYYCRKHARTCQPTREAFKFLQRYTLDSIRRVKEYARLRKHVEITVHHGDSRVFDYGERFDGLITSPPYPGRIDYHEQHRYAFELLDLPDLRAEEIGAAEKGTSRSAIDAYVSDMIAVFENARGHMIKNALAIIVVDDQRGLYDDILTQAGFTIQERRKRHVNRRTGRRQGEFFEEIILARA